MSKFIIPDYRVPDVTSLSADWLAERRIAALLLDVDCTLKRYSAETVEPSVHRWLERMAEAQIGLRLVSNGLAERIERFAEGVRLPVTARALKPLPGGVRRALAESRFDPKTTAMVGNQLFADVLAGNLAGIRTVLVNPIHPEEEPWFTRIKRPPERFALRRMKKP